jgi:excisionase family DNA binding protein
VERNTESPRYLKPKDLARVFGVTTRTVTTWVSEGRVPCYKIGRSVFFSPKEIDRMMARNRYVGPIRCPELGGVTAQP